MANAHNAHQQPDFMEHMRLFATFIPRGLKLVLLGIAILLGVIFIGWLVITIIYWSGAAHEHHKIRQEEISATAHGSREIHTRGIPNPTAVVSRVIANTFASVPSAPMQPLETMVDEATPSTKVFDVDAPPVTDKSNQDADANWSHWVRGHAGYNIYSKPEFPSATYRMECWDIASNQAVLATSQPCLYATAFRWQSTSDKGIKIPTGFMLRSRP
jgi:hypothetical protein